MLAPQHSLTTGENIANAGLEGAPGSAAGLPPRQACARNTARAPRFPQPPRRRCASDHLRRDAFVLMEALGDLALSNQVPLRTVLAVQGRRWCRLWRTAEQASSTPSSSSSQQVRWFISHREYCSLLIQSTRPGHIMVAVDTQSRHTCTGIPTPELYEMTLCSCIQSGEVSLHRPHSAAGQVPAAAAQHRGGRGQWLEGRARHASPAMHHHGEGRGAGRVD